MTAERHKTGAEEYGAFKFLENDTLDMLCEELADISNYARYTFIKVKLLQAALAEAASASGVDTSTEAMLGQLDGDLRNAEGWRDDPKAGFGQPGGWESE